MATEYSKKTNADLVEILKSRSLPHTGKKADLVGRLQEADKAEAEKVTAGAPATATTTEPATTDTTTKVDAEDVIDWDDDDTTTVEPVTATTATTTADTAKATPADTKNEATTATEATSATKTPAVAPAESTPAEAPAKETETKADTTAVAKEGEADSVQEPEAKPAVEYTMGLSTTDFEAELAKRKARAAKFGIEEDAATAIEQATKAAERAKRFGTATEGKTTVGVKGLDEALSSERPRKRGRGADDEDGGRGGKRTDFGGRGRGRGGRRGNRNNNGGRRGSNQRNDNRPTDGNNKNTAKPMSEQDIAAMEKRKARFATAA